jgi:phosphate transport system protein
MPEQHTVRSYDDELSDLEQKISEMGGLAEYQVADSVTALSNHDGAMAQRIITTDQRIDSLQRQIEDAAVSMIARPSLHISPSAS